ncbi:hypothetical protein [Neorhodopirellula pilleata]|uniref:Peptidase C-terminal archaeal/bacterial domain-containing protein n=1 Tax=Neorhodopirellula pilleata TaxID=2714738 RepID=A0A5C6A8P1_9BACT|nr:hypothetical protein [Neorhodopirellula pilleata]TWT96334.1 hypothetical protein Pla100_28110 [Neorhodopirellula pilleata]
MSHRPKINRVESQPERSRHVHGVLVAALSLFWGGGDALAQLPVIGLRSLSQSFFAPGETYEVSIAEGANTDEVRELLVSHPGITATLVNGEPRPFTGNDMSRYGNFRVSIAADVPEGRYEASAVGRFGISNPRSIVVQNAVRIVPTVGNTATTATSIEAGPIYCRRTSPQQRDYYSFVAVPGKQYALRLIAQAVDSQLIGAVSILDVAGRTLDSAIGSDHSDLQMTLTATDSRPLTIAVHDALYRGGAAYQYGIQLVEGDATQNALQTEDPKSVSVEKRDPTWVEESGSPIPLEVPALVEATFDSADDVDQYTCQLFKNQPVHIEIVSDRMGEPTDARLIIDRSVANASGVPTWQRIATFDDGPNLSDSVVRLGTGDPITTFQPPEDGEYRITVFDSDTGQSLGNRQRYQLAIGPPRSDWQLLAYQIYPHKDAKTSQPSGSHLARAGATTIRVFVNRHSMSGPIRVSIPELLPGLSCRPAWIAGNQNRTDLVITASDQAPTQYGSIKIVGEASRDGQNESGTARVATVVWPQDGYRTAALTRLTDQFMIASSEWDTDPISIHAGGDETVVAKKGTKVTVPIKVTRREGGADVIVLRAQGLPPGVAAGDLTIAKDKSEAEWTIDVKNDAFVGTYTFWGQSETKVKFSVNPQALVRETEYRDALKTLRSNPERSNDHAQIDKEIAEAEKRIEAIKKQVAAKDLTVYVASPPITLEVQ